MTLKVAQGRTIRLPAEFLAGESAADPTAPLVQILDPSNTPVITDAVPECDGVGLYHYDFAVAEDAPLGSWTARWTAAVDGETVSGEDAFEVIPSPPADKLGDVESFSQLIPPAGPESSRSVRGKSRFLPSLARRKRAGQASPSASSPLEDSEDGLTSKSETAMTLEAEVAEPTDLSAVSVPLEASEAIPLESSKADPGEASGFTAEPEVAQRARTGTLARLSAALVSSRRGRLAAVGLVLLLALIAAIVFALRTSKNEDPAVTLQEGIDAHLDGDLEKASIQYRKTLEADPNNKLAHYNLGVIAQVRDRPQEAERFYLRALRQDPSFVPALFNLAFVKGEIGDNQAAVDLYRRVLSLNPSLAAAHLNLGAILRRIGQVQEGDAEIRRALELDPGLRRRVSGQGRPQTDNAP